MSVKLIVTRHKKPFDSIKENLSSPSGIDANQRDHFYEVGMFRYLRLKKHLHKVEPSPGSLTAQWLSKDACVPATLKQLNELPEGAKKRIYRALIPPNLLTKFNIDPISWKGRGDYQLTLQAESQSGEVNISIGKMSDSPEEFFCLQLWITQSTVLISIFC